MLKYHPGALLFPILRVTTGTRQDSGTEGAIIAYMNRQYYFQFLDEQLSSKTKDHSILQKSLFCALRSVEIIALSRALSIYHISVVMPHRWLTGKCHELADEDFSMTDMNLVAELTHKAFVKIESDPKLFLNEEFMTTIYKEVAEKVKPFQEYLDFMFEENTCFPFGSKSPLQKILPFDLLRAELFYPVRVENIQSNEMTLKIGTEMARVMALDMEDELKATKDYILDGIHSVQNTDEEERQANMGRHASNSLSEACHAHSTINLDSFINIRLDSSAAMGQSKMNNDLGRGHRAFISRGHEKSSGTTRDYEHGSLYSYHAKLIDSLMSMCRDRVQAYRSRFDEALERQSEIRREKAELALSKKLEDKGDGYIENLYLNEMYDHPVCWRTVEEAVLQYNQLGSKAAQLRCVKRQLLIRYLGLGWNEAYHPWSEDGVEFSPEYLFKFLCDIVIPLSQTKEVPDRPPIELPAPPEIRQLGTVTNDSLALTREGKYKEFESKWTEEREKREDKGIGDRWMMYQRDTQPTINSSLEGFKIEMLFDCGDEGLDWFHGEVKSVVSEKSRVVKIKWDTACLAVGDANCTQHKLFKQKWNPATPGNGAWRQYIQSNN